MTELMDRSAPAAAFDAFVRAASETSSKQQAWTPEDGALPSLFISHGAPPLFDDAGWIDELFGWSQSLPKPRSILIVSAHWESAPLALSASAAATPLVYDFGGFHPRYYAMTYETPDAGALARQVAATVPDGTSLHQHPSRGLDHGAWVPLKVMYPLGDVPVLQLSIPTEDPAALLDLGRRLQPLRDEGVLVIGSGFMTHGLPFLTPSMWRGEAVPSWSVDFDAWASEALARGDLDTLADYKRAPGMPYAHPSAEHYLPLLIALGAADDPERPVDTTVTGYMAGLSKRSFQTT
jgi:4,5-DOPA dioxygenase extradiol